jgi:hypothetical protein
LAAFILVRQELRKKLKSYIKTGCKKAIGAKKIKESRHSMKKFILLVAGLLCYAHTSVWAQDEVLSNIKFHFKQGNAKEIARYLTDLVEININGEKGSYSKTQAEFVLRDFFKANPPSDFQKIHQGSSREGLTFLIANYTSPKGTYRVYLVIKQFKGNYLVDTIDFNLE